MAASAQHALLGREWHPFAQRLTRFAKSPMRFAHHSTRRILSCAALLSLGSITEVSEAQAQEGVPADRSVATSSGVPTAGNESPSEFDEAREGSTAPSDTTVQHEPSQLTIIWDGPEECGPRGALNQRTRELLGEDADSSKVHVAARATQLTSGGYRIELQLHGAVNGTRSFESMDCGEAIQAAAVVLALAINPAALLHRSDEPNPTPQNKPLQPDSTNAPPLPLEESQKERSFGGYAQVSGRLSGGVTPFPAWGAEITGGLERDWIRVQLGATSHRVPERIWILLAAPASLPSEQALMCVCALLRSLSSRCAVALAFGFHPSERPRRVSTVHATALLFSTLRGLSLNSA